MQVALKLEEPEVGNTTITLTHTGKHAPHSSSCPALAMLRTAALVCPRPWKWDRTRR